MKPAYGIAVVLLSFVTIGWSLPANLVKYPNPQQIAAYNVKESDKKLAAAAPVVAPKIVTVPVAVEATKLQADAGNKPETNVAGMKRIENKAKVTENKDSSDPKTATNVDSMKSDENMANVTENKDSSNQKTESEINNKQDAATNKDSSDFQTDDIISEDKKEQVTEQKDNSDHKTETEATVDGMQTNINDLSNQKTETNVDVVNTDDNKEDVNVVPTETTEQPSEVPQNLEMNSVPLEQHITEEHHNEIKKDGNAADAKPVKVIINVPIVINTDSSVPVALLVEGQNIALNANQQPNPAAVNVAVSSSTTSNEATPQ